MELAHLNDTDLLDSKEICIREKPCQSVVTPNAGAALFVPHLCRTFPLDSLGEQVYPP